LTIKKAGAISAAPALAAEISVDHLSDTPIRSEPLESVERLEAQRRA
jgi:hypothetical protein